MTLNKNIIRDKNLTRLKQFMFKEETALKSEMAKETDLSVVTINSLVKQLVEEVVILEGESIQQGLGRPALTYHFNYQQQYFLLISLQECSKDRERKLILLGKIVDLAGNVYQEKKINFDDIHLPNLIAHIQELLELVPQIERIALSIPGKIHQSVVKSSWYDLMDGWNIEAALAEVSPIPITIQNDAHVLTVGYTLLKGLDRQKTYVGIFYPENSLPGISIYSNELLVEGGKQLAGEAKYLPHLINTTEPIEPSDLIHNLITILEIYNVVIAPDAFVISSASSNPAEILTAIQQSKTLTKQFEHLNQPAIYFVEHFQEALSLGLRWLATQNSIYNL